MEISYQTDSGIATRGCLGLIVLQVDETIESEFRRLTDIDGVAVYITRVPSGAQLNEDTIRKMEAAIPVAANLLPPAASFDVIAYACTSGATIIGPGNVARIIREAKTNTGVERFPGVRVTDPLTAAGAATRALGVTRLGFVTPYIPSVSLAMRNALESEGLTINGFRSFEQSEEALVARIAPKSTYEAILDVGRHTGCEAVFVSCTNLRTLDVLAEAERALNRPVISSNQALAWHMLRQAGIYHKQKGLGRLMET